MERHQHHAWSGAGEDEKRVERKHIAKEIMKIFETGVYNAPTRVLVPVHLSDWAENVRAVEPYSPEALAKLSTPFAVRELLQRQHLDQPCQVMMEKASSFESRLVIAAPEGSVPLVMNFANANYRGGGFENGASAQEEELCRCSTLYASLTSEEAGVMYRYNHEHDSPVDSDFMLLSPEVLVLREHGEYLLRPHHVAVATVAAPNRNSRRARDLSDADIEAVLRQRLLRFFCMVAHRGYRDLVLGAWGCGAFGNDPAVVAAIFHDLLYREGFANVFRNISFSIFGGGRNYDVFAKVFRS